MTEGRVIGLRGDHRYVREPNEKVIDRCRRLLEQAESGEIQGIASVVLCDDGSCEHALIGRANMYEFIGRLECLSHVLKADAEGDDI